MRKVNILGSPGSGKSTLAKKFAEKHRLQYVDIDSLLWLENREKRDASDLQSKLYRKMDGSDDGWVIDGFLGERQGKRPFRESDTIVFLDVQLQVRMWRSFRRGVKRIITRELLWGTCKENPYRLFKLQRFTMRSNPRLKEMVKVMQTDPKYSKHSILVFKSNKAANEWLDRMIVD